jgi:hypothetical protein
VNHNSEYYALFTLTPNTTVAPFIIDDDLILVDSKDDKDSVPSLPRSYR